MPPNVDHSPKRRKDETPTKTRIPVPINKTPIPSIKVLRKPLPEVLDEEVCFSTSFRIFKCAHRYDTPRVELKNIGR